MVAALTILFGISILVCMYESYKREQAESRNHIAFTEGYSKGKSDAESDSRMKLKTEVFIWSLKKDMEESK